MTSKVIVCFPQSMAGTAIGGGFVVESDVTVHGKVYPIEFIRYNDSTFVTRSIWASFIIRNSVLRFLHKNNIDAQGVLVADLVR